MFGLDFLFAAAFWALPVAGVPVILHMLFRRKAPIVPFSTLRFVKESIQQTAARRRIQRWILLACRVLLLALLIWAIAQPVKILASGWFDSGKSIVAAIVVDTSYSMQLKQQEVTLLEKANDIVQELLREPLRNAKIAVFQSQPAPADKPEALQTAAEIQSVWRPLEPQPAPRPLSDRVNAAVALLSRQTADQKWLVVISDMQSREFPAALPQPDDTRVILFDLHPDKPTSHGVTNVRMEPEQPIPGVGSNAVVEIAGRSGDAAFVNLNVKKLNGESLKTISNLQATFDSAGRTRVRVPLKEGLPVERWLLVNAKLQRDDDLMWDNSRSLLVELPPRQTVTFLESPAQPAACNFIRLALDPWEGKVAAWPLEVAAATDLSGREPVAVAPLSEWPDQVRSAKLVDFVKRGGTLVLLLQPGLEQMWAHQGDKQKAALAQLLPAAIAPTLPGGGSAGATGTYRPVPPARPDRVLEGLTDPTFRLDLLGVRRFVPFAATTDPNVTTVLYLSPLHSDGRAFTQFGLLYRRNLGAGAVYTFTSLPDARYMNPPTHPLLLPLLVSMSLQAPSQRDAQNVEIGDELALSGSRYAQYSELELATPGDERYRVKPQTDAKGRRLVFARTGAPGVYTWRVPGQAEPVAVGNVQLPAAESDLVYKKAQTVLTPGPECIIARSFADLQATVAKINEPEPKWTWPIAVVLLLICAEALLASMSELWKPISLRALLPKMASDAEPARAA